MRSLRFLAAAALCVWACALPAGAATPLCSGFAPTGTSCTTGAHVRATTLSQDVTGDFDYVGTLETSLVWSGGARIFRCTYTTSALDRTCLSFGEFPPVGASFTHRCRSLVPGTAATLAPGATVNGVEGGAGQWECSVTY
jgi:hypothetical protein